jgi:hypothetical protein
MATIRDVPIAVGALDPAITEVGDEAIRELR